jgi:hypothetical protein
VGPTVYLSCYDVINEQKSKAFMATYAAVIAQSKASSLYFLSHPLESRWMQGWPFATFFAHCPR